MKHKNELLKKVLVINDLSGFGNCSLLASLPILNTLKCQTTPLPTTVLTHQSEYETYKKLDLSNFVNDALELYKTETFDAVFTGYMSDINTIKNISNFLTNSKSAIYCDPILADNNKLYDGFTFEHVLEMKNIVKIADYTTPNITEACLLTDTNYTTLFDVKNFNELKYNVFKVGRKVLEIGAKNVIITGVVYNDSIYNFVVNKNEEFFVCSPYYKTHFSGTGDIIASIILGKTLNNTTLLHSVKRATKFIEQVIKKSIKLNREPKSGLIYQLYLNKLK